MMHTLRIACLFSASVMLAAGTALATTYDPAADFSTVSNPNGVWSYGVYDVTGTTFTPYASSTNAWHGNANLVAWSQFAYDSNSYSVVGHNPTGSTQMESPGGSISIDPSLLFFHPGNGGEKATLRFTAPSTGTVDINAVFKAADLSGGNRDVHVYINGIDQIPGSFLIGSKSSAPPVSDTQSGVPITAGGTIDFSVGFGSDNVYFNDATTLTASLNMVPEPAGCVLFGIGTLGLSLVARRRRRA